VTPTYDVVPLIQIDSTALKALSPAEVVYGFEAIRDYEPMINVSWPEVAKCIRAEGAWLTHAQSAIDESQFDAILAEAYGDDPQDGIEEAEDFDYLFRNLDVGVAGLVFALSAAGYATCTSCRGHDGIARPPQVGLGTEPERLARLASYTRGAGCGLEVADGIAWIYARSVTDLHAMAQAILDDQAEFEVLGPPPWLEGARAILEDDDYPDG
jgi:hypothetical protein